MYLIISGWNGCRSIIFLLEQKKRMSSVWFRESKNADIFRFETQDSTGLKKLKHNRWNRQFDNRLFNLRLDIFQWTKVINKNVNTLLCSRWSTGSGFPEFRVVQQSHKVLISGFRKRLLLHCIFGMCVPEPRGVHTVRWWAEVYPQIYTALSEKKRTETQQVLKMKKRKHVLVIMDSEDFDFSEPNILNDRIRFLYYSLFSEVLIKDNKNVKFVTKPSFLDII